MEDVFTKNTMEILDPGNIKIYETDFVHKVEKIPLLERLTPEVSLGDEMLIESNDEFYKRIYDLGDSVQKELNKKETNYQEEIEEHRKDHDKPNNDTQAELNEEAIKIKKGLEKMRQLDSRLSDLMKKEKEIKKQRSQLTSPEKNEDIVDHSNSDMSFELEPPLFVTQPREKDGAVIVECIESETHTTENDLNEPETCTENESEKTQDKKQKTSNEANFIERNKQLASESSQTVAMTEAEKKRLEELLEKDEEERDSNAGYSFTKDDLNQLITIDSQLEMLVPALGGRSSQALTHKQPGEKVLITIQEDRYEQNRLAEINRQLEMLHDKENAEISLSDEQLCYLIEQTEIEQTTSIKFN